MTNFQCVREFNRAFDMVSKEPKEYLGYEEDKNGLIKINPIKFCRAKIFDSHSLIRLRLNLIKEEIEELTDAIKVNDIKETRDAIGDILYVVYGMADILGIDIDYIFRNTLQNEVFKYYLDIKSNDNLYLHIDKIIIASENGAKTITNFNSVKIFFTELLGNDENDSKFYGDKKETEKGKCKDTYTYANILDKLTQLYLQLEKECERETIIYDDYSYTMNNTSNSSSSSNSISNTNKFLIVSQIIYNLLKWTYIMAHKYEFNADSDFAIIHESNMSKLCETECDARATVADYEIKYKAGKSPYDSPYYYELPELGKWIVKNKSSGKALKNIKYKEVSFE